MIFERSILLLAALASSGLAGCDGRSSALAEAPFAVSFFAVSDDGAPLPGVTFTASGRTLATTGERGTDLRTVKGREGQLLGVSVLCPAGFVPDDEPTALRLSSTRRIGESDAAAVSHRATCARKSRSVVVVVRAEHGESLPVLVDGQPVGKTRADGTAHILVQRDREVRSVTVELDTDARRDLRPQSPSRTFDLSGRDAIVLLEQAFVPIVVRAARKAAPRRHIPYRID